MAQNNKLIRLIVGLGNPGNEYRHTRHNMGFMVLDKIADTAGARFSADIKFFGDTARVHTKNGDVWLLKPTTYMNASGSAVQAMASYYKISPEEILVVHDELDIAPGIMKMKFGGGNAGHNGLKDITSKLSTPNFWRLRIGIGHPRVYCPQQQVYDWVLGCPNSEHESAIEPCLAAAAKTVDNLASGAFDRVQRTIGKYGSQPKAKKTKPDAGNGAEQQATN